MNCCGIIHYVIVLFTVDLRFLLLVLGITLDLGIVCLVHEMFIYELI